MKVTVTNRVLRAGLLRVGKIRLPRFGPLRCMRIEACGEQLVIQVSDGDATARTSVAAEIDSPGGTHIGYEDIARLSRMLPDSAVLTIAANERYLTISWGFGSARLPVPDDSPDDTLPDLAAMNWIGTAAAAFRHCAQLYVMAGRDDARPVLEQVSFRVTGGQMVVAATNAIRLGEISAELEKHSGGEWEWQIHAPYLSALCQTVGKRGDVDMYINSAHVAFVDGDTTFSVSQSDLLPFPRYQEILEWEPKIGLTVNPGDLCRAVKALSIYNGADRYVTLTIAGGDEEMIWASRDGHISVTVQAQATPIRSRRPLKIGLNIDYMKAAADWVRKINGGAIEFRAIDDTNPVYLGAIAPGISATAAVMPLNPVGFIR